ncbi:MAG: zinc-binding dehydrogenase [Halobacteriales archaeon]|nr:zinc-binding dehydrogenase [Halobacteriales archaeon]
MESKAAVLHEPTKNHDFLGDLPAKIEMVEVSEPIGEEVLVKIEAASLCHTDVSCVVGETGEPKPVVLGHEGAGVVAAIGDEVTTLEVGDHVVLGRIACGKCIRCRMGKSNLCLSRRQSKGTLRTGDTSFTGSNGDPYYHYHGVSSFTEYTNVTQEVAIKVNKKIPLEQATLLGCGIFTGVGAVANAANIEPGSSVVIFGAGGVGLSGVQGAVLRGATEIIVVDVVPSKFDIALKMGATSTINSMEEDPVERIREITGGGADYTFDMVGHPRVFEQAVESLAVSGTAVLVGTPSTPVNEVSINLREMVKNEKRIIGAFNGSYNLPIAIPMLADLVVEGKLSLEELITSSLPLDNINEAMHQLENGAEIRQVIVP